MSKRPIPTWYIVLVVVKKGNHFLLVQENRKGYPWFLPAGRVEQGESLAAAARRETMEEAGVHIELDGVLRVEHTPLDDFSRVRVIYLAHPITDKTPKTSPDEHSLQAAWIGLEQFPDLNLRGKEVFHCCRHVVLGGPVYPLDIVQFEGAPWKGTS